MDILVLPESLQASRGLGVERLPFESREAACVMGTRIVDRGERSESGRSELFGQLPLQMMLGEGAYLAFSGRPRPLTRVNLLEYRMPTDVGWDISYWATGRTVEQMYGGQAKTLGKIDFPIGYPIEVTFQSVLGFDLGNARLGYPTPARTLNIEREKTMCRVIIIDSDEDRSWGGFMELSVPRENPRNFGVVKMFGVNTNSVALKRFPLRLHEGGEVEVDVTVALALPGHLLLVPVFSQVDGTVLGDYRLVHASPPDRDLAPTLWDIGSIFDLDQGNLPYEFTIIEEGELPF